MAWDHNLAFSGFGCGGPGLPEDGRDVPGFGIDEPPADLPEGGVPDGAPGLRGGAGSDEPLGDVGRPPTPVGIGEVPGAEGNVLVERFFANETWSELYEQRLAEVTDVLVASGTAESILAEWVELLITQAGELISEATVGEEAAQLAAQLAEMMSHR